MKDIINGLSGILNKEAKDMISIFAMVLIPMGLMYSVVFLPQRLIKEVNKPEKCWEVQSVNGKAYKVNTCTGVVEVISEDSERSQDQSMQQALQDTKPKTEMKLVTQIEDNGVHTTNHDANKSAKPIKNP